MIEVIVAKVRGKKDFFVFLWYHSQVIEGIVFILSERVWPKYTCAM